MGSSGPVPSGRDRAAATALAAALALAACAGGDADRRPPPPGAGPRATGSTTSTTDLEATVRVGDPVPARVVEVRYRVEVATSEPGVEDFAPVVDATLGDARGWSRAGFRLVRDDAGAPYRIVVAEGPVVDRLCRPYRTSSTYSCQNGPVVALNADRWRRATPQWTGDLATYRQMLVNHEVGHLLGQHHPVPQCHQPGLPAPVMAQQSTELDGCLPNPWPLDWEVDLAALHREPLAPPFSR